MINWMKMGFSKNEYSEGVKIYGLTVKPNAIVPEGRSV